MRQSAVLGGGYPSEPVTRELRNPNPSCPLRLLYHLVHVLAVALSFKFPELLLE